MKKIKVLRIIARLNVGGPAIHVAILSSGLDKLRFTTVLACGELAAGEADMSDYARSLEIEPVYIVHLRRELSFIGDLRAFINIYRLIQRERPDIVHTHTAKAGTLGRSAAILYNILRRKRNRVKLIHTFHGHIFEGYFSKFASGIFLSVEKILACFTQIIITVSDSVKTDLVARGVCRAQKVRVVPLGFDLKRLLDIPLPDADPKVIGIVGRLEPVKNHRLFLKAAAVLAAQDESLKFKIIGGGRLKDDLARFADELGITGRVEFAGWLRDLVSLYSGLDMVVLSSFNEGTPVSLIEAMAAGRPVVATEVGGVVDLLAGRGVLVPSDDAGAFADGIKRLIFDKELRQNFSREGREFVKNKFTKERLIRDIEILYADLFK